MADVVREATTFFYDGLLPTFEVARVDADYIVQLTVARTLRHCLQTGISPHSRYFYLDTRVA